MFLIRDRQQLAFWNPSQKKNALFFRNHSCSPGEPEPIELLNKHWWKSTPHRKQKADITLVLPCHRSKWVSRIYYLRWANSTPNENCTTLKYQFRLFCWVCHLYIYERNRTRNFIYIDWRNGHWPGNGSPEFLAQYFCSFKKAKTTEPLFWKVRCILLKKDVSNSHKLY
jgi:hypothetical protein